MTIEKENYISNGGRYCPFCESSNIVKTETESEDALATQKCSCNQCNKKWIDTYVLVDVIEDKY